MAPQPRRSTRTIKPPDRLIAQATTKPANARQTKGAGRKGGNIPEPQSSIQAVRHIGLDHQNPFLARASTLVALPQCPSIDTWLQKVADAEPVESQASLESPELPDGYTSSGTGDMEEGAGSSVVTLPQEGRHFTARP